MYLRSIVARLRPRPAALASLALLVLITALLSSVGANASDRAQEGRAADVKPTIVFIHGGWADSSGWNDEVVALRDRGFPVIARRTRCAV